MTNIHQSALLPLVIMLVSGTANANSIYLNATHQPLDCPLSLASACRAVDSVEATGYDMARKGKISWTEMVDRFYRERNRIFPGMKDDHVVIEIRSYQRVLAEKKDAGRITETEWVYLLSKQFSEITAREDARDAQIRRD